MKLLEQRLETTHTQRHVERKAQSNYIDIKMSYLNKAWMAVGVAAVQSHGDQGLRLKSGIKSFQSGRRSFCSSSATAVTATGDADPNLWPMSLAVGEVDRSVSRRDVEERRVKAEESLRNVMYLSCWGQG
ncbi:hypothetical protein MLD38_015795 [Melastoma candidum]|uniref:Uncharacterized protein n=1 Tax=Melastoma candidum TaxID=119954 RepID=A0ACB9RHF7_9MYRT|nr:hypothetical protein MLD38_015795 [Melastoma candidum]